MKEMEVDHSVVNVDGGAIALGHPIGATGGMLIGTAVEQLHRFDKETALVAMCTGGRHGHGNDSGADVGRLLGASAGPPHADHQRPKSTNHEGTIMNDSAIAALLVWTGLHVILMLALALNVTRHRFQSANEGYDERRLERAIRAHGNNIEYVPIILFCIALLVARWRQPHLGSCPLRHAVRRTLVPRARNTAVRPAAQVQSDRQFRHLGGHAGHRDCADLPRFGRLTGPLHAPPSIQARRRCGRRLSSKGALAQRACEGGTPSSRGIPLGSTAVSRSEATDETRDRGRPLRVPSPASIRPSERRRSR